MSHRWVIFDGESGGLAFESPMPHDAIERVARGLLQSLAIANPAAHAALVRREAEVAGLRVGEHAAAPERRTVDCTIEFGGELEPPPNLLTAADAAALDDATTPALEDQAATRTFAERYGADVEALTTAFIEAYNDPQRIEPTFGGSVRAGIRAVLQALGIEVRG